MREEQSEIYKLIVAFPINLKRSILKDFLIT
jgi:hypothetical protein